MRKVLNVVSVMLISSLVTIGQSKELSHDEFFPLVRTAGTVTQGQPYRSTTTTRSFEGDVAKLDQVQTRESLPNGNERLVQKKGDEVIEVITVKNKNYQRENGGKWRIVTTPENVTLFRSISGPYTSEYSTSEDSLGGQKVSVLTWFIKKGNGQFSESKWIVASNGRIVREESRGGTLGEQNSISWDEVVVYDYNIGALIIRAPIK